MTSIRSSVSIATVAGLFGVALQACSSSSSGGSLSGDGGSDAMSKADSSLGDTGVGPMDSGAPDTRTSDAADSAPEAGQQSLSR